jgi:hypothetical protein
MRSIDYKALYREGYAIVQMDDLTNVQRSDSVGVIMPIASLTPKQIHDLDDPSIKTEYAKGRREEMHVVKDSD